MALYSPTDDIGGRSLPGPARHASRYQSPAQPDRFPSGLGVLLRWSGPRNVRLQGSRVLFLLAKVLIPVFNSVRLAPIGRVYEVQALEVSEPDKPLRTALVQSSTPLGGRDPRLYVSF